MLSWMTHVSCNVVLDDGRVMPCAQDFSLNMFLRQRWIDQRLAFGNDTTFNESLTLSFHFNSMLWVPDIFAKNEMHPGEFHEVPVPNILIEVSPDGGVIYSQRSDS